MQALTLIQERKKCGKVVSGILAFGLIGGVVATQTLITTNPIMAYETNVIKNTIPITQQMNKEKERQVQTDRWNVKIREKYKNGTILTLSPGIKHIRMTKYVNKRPIKINIVEINQNINPNINIEPVLSNNSLKGKQTIRTLAKSNNSLIAVNGTFFKPQSGIPLGTLMIDGKLLTGPIYNRVALGIGENEFKMARVEINGEIKGFFNSAKIDNINQPRMLATHVIAYTTDWGKYSPATPKYGIQIKVKDNRVIEVSDSPMEIPENGYVISGPKKQLEPLTKEFKVSVNIKTNPQWEDIKHIISGGPYLIKENNIYIDTKEQKLQAITGKNPRTAIGYTKDKELIIVVIDGREEASVGMTLTELAYFMKSIGCVNAMNVDGGGSSVMYVNGKIVNNPAQKGGIALSNALTIGLNENIAQSNF